MINEKNRQTYYGALNLSKNELMLQGYKTGNGDCTVDFLKKLIEANPGNKIIIFGDGVSYHRGETMQHFLKELNGDLEEKNWRVTNVGAGLVASESATIRVKPAPINQVFWRKVVEFRLEDFADTGNG